MIEHRPWVGSKYEKGQGILLWGFSHHRTKDELDSADYTEIAIKDAAISGKYWFFNRIFDLFGYPDKEKFWHDVAFANTLPDAVVGDIYSFGSYDQRMAVSPRVTRILSELKPRCTILFSRKGWPMWPPFHENQKERKWKTDGIVVEWGRYQVADGVFTTAYNLPHPQFERKEGLRQAVAAVLDHSRTLE